MMEQQLNLFEATLGTDKRPLGDFSAGRFGQQTARLALERKLIDITEISTDFNRQTVSYQLSKNDCLHRWLKYKEGFSSDLVKRLLNEFGTKQGQTILDPFAGSGTTALVCKMKGINSIGFDILPMSRIAINAKKAVFDYDISELTKLIEELENLYCPNSYVGKTKYIAITNGAYPDRTEKDIAFFTEWIQHSIYSNTAKNLILLCMLNSLEKVSYTSKDGQFLRWDHRSEKMLLASEYRNKNGKPPLVIRLNKGDLPTLKQTLLEELKSVVSDCVSIQRQTARPPESSLRFHEGSVLFELPAHESAIIDGVITSPPYCNRYDYTRTYALELAYLGVTDEKIKQLRQELLTCTVENKPKLDRLQKHYTSLGKQSDFNKTLKIIQANEALNEINQSLNERNKNGDINNKGVLRMVNGYFTELAFIYSEVFRLCKSGAKAAFVNDNVRYGGEVIPVDFISTELAEQIGFKPVKVYSLKQQKGNSSQQMAKFGRIPLRKSITIWQKP